MLNICPVCEAEYSTHAVSGELTCFLHGNSNGSEFEKNNASRYLHDSVGLFQQRPNAGRLKEE